MRVPVIFMWEYPLGDISALTVIEYPIVQFIQIPGGYCHIWAILVCAAGKGMVFKQFTLG